MAADAIDKRVPKDFHHGKPEQTEGWREITDPEGVKAGRSNREEYPKHLARAVDGGREVRSVVDSADEAAARADGFRTHQELDAAKKAGSAEPSSEPTPTTGKQATGPKRKQT